MECQKIANLFDDASNKNSKFRTKDWVRVNDESKGTYDVGTGIKFENVKMLKFSLWDYSDAYIQVRGTITVNNNNKKVIFKNCPVKPKIM